MGKIAGIFQTFLPRLEKKMKNLIVKSKFSARAPKIRKWRQKRGKDYGAGARTLIGIRLQVKRQTKWGNGKSNIFDN